jgi:hypothetical protein
MLHGDLVELQDLQALPTDGNPITTWLDVDTAWRIVSEGLEEVIRNTRSKGISLPASRYVNFTCSTRSEGDGTP